ncbi:restriction endonuclease subunit S [Campylobacter devanensis]|uniref:restriction endonuclease subunit S n=1 Tax=Campylobacter devanensis TaxID=3161138 RepID=UPI000A33A272|nr:restriction endonuclease subunit S [Campylobacter sp. P0087]
MTRAMKDSGIEWIGEIPKDWKLPKVKQLFSIGRGRVISQLDLEDTGYPVYSSQTKNNGCLGYISTYDFDRSQLTWTTDGANAGTVFLREGKHNCTNVCGTLTPKNDENSLLYLKYALEYIVIYHKRADINGFKIMNNEMAEIKVTLPSMPEQQKIADFLDEKCSHIDSVLEKVRASIDEYKQLKQSVITQAVTKGIRPNRPMKDSGNKYYGEIPNNWYICKTLYCLSMPITDGPHSTPELFDTGIPFVSAEAVSCGNGSIDFNHIRGYISQEFYDECCLKYIPQINDVYMIKSGATTGKVSIVDTDRIFTIWSPLAVFRCNEKKTLPKFMYYAIQSDQYQKQIALNWSFGTQQNIGMRVLESLKICVPSLDEQQEIVSYLDDKCSEIDKLITKKEQLIAELETYKKSLIYEYVTGKKEVI